MVNHEIVPQPARIEKVDGYFKLTTETVIWMGSPSEKTARLFFEGLSSCLGKTLQVQIGNVPPALNRYSYDLTDYHPDRLYGIRVYYHWQSDRGCRGQGVLQKK